MYTVLAIIPARGGSKGVPRKNVRLLAGIPLLAHSINAAQGSARITQCIVSTDDDEIAAIAQAYGAAVPFMRPASLASDTASSVDVTKHAVTAYERIAGTTFDIILLLQPTAPLRRSEDIDRALSLLDDDATDSVASFCPVQHMHPYYLYTIEDARAKPLMDVPAHITRRQDFPPVYMRNGAIYAARRSILFQHDTFLGPALRPYVMPYERSVNIDSEVDFRLAELVLAQGSDGENS